MYTVHTGDSISIVETAEGPVYANTTVDGVRVETVKGRVYVNTIVAVRNVKTATALVYANINASDTIVKTAEGPVYANINVCDISAKTAVGSVYVPTDGDDIAVETVTITYVHTATSAYVLNSFYRNTYSSNTSRQCSARSPTTLINPYKGPQRAYGPFR